MVVLLAMGSAALHPLKEVFIKHNAYPEGLCLAFMSIWTLIAGIHAWVLGLDFMSVIPVWYLVIISSMAIFFYHFFMIVALSDGDVSVYYPIARSYPLMIVAIGMLLFGHQYSVSVLGGIALVVIGAFFLQYHDENKLVQNKRALSMAFLAMTCSAVYSLADAAAMQDVEPVIFFFWDSLLIVPMAVLLFSLTRPRSRSVTEHLFGGWKITPVGYILAGVTSYLSYIFILFAYQAGGDVAAVSSIRQASVPFSIILSFFLLKELRFRRQMLWSLILVAGIITIILEK